MHVTAAYRCCLRSYRLDSNIQQRITHLRIFDHSSKEKNHEKKIGLQMAKVRSYDSMCDKFTAIHKALTG